MTRQIQLSWDEPATGEHHQFIFTTPIAIGRKLNEVLTDSQKQQFSQAILRSPQVSAFHAVITAAAEQIFIEDRSTNGIRVNDRKITPSTPYPLVSGDTLKIKPYSVTVTALNLETITTTEVAEVSQVVEAGATSAGIVAPKILFNDDTVLLSPKAVRPQQENLLLPDVFNRDYVSVDELKLKGLLSPNDEKDYVALGGGLGSFTWVDTLRIYGVKQTQIAVLGRGNVKPYGRYQLLCRNSQIPDYERLRSGSDSCPDNIWAFPGYALREAWRDAAAGRLLSAGTHLWKVFAEPAFADTYTPRSGDVFAAIDREASRIGWYSDRYDNGYNMWQQGYIRAIRKTLDDRYVIAYYDPNRVAKGQKLCYRFLVGRYLHISTGYAAARFLPDLLAYRNRTGDTQSVVNAYENHEHIYQHLKQRGGTVIVRGEGIVASRIIQRLDEVHQHNADVKIIHLVRTTKTEPNQFGVAQRYRENGWEFQPYNWPKATWGGDMRARLEAANPPERSKLLEQWGGTTTASRTDWRQIIQTGLKQLWYEREVGEVLSVDRNQQDGITISIQRINFNKREIIDANFIIDATGVEAKPMDDPFFKDLISTYNLPLNPFDRLEVKNDFQVNGMENGGGRVYAAGVITLGGPYAAVDTFLGLQYVAQRSAYSLVRAKAPGINPLQGLSSLGQWLKWVTNHVP
jgi:pSer/pThr/pTyr-binding forkhead associated (FHA) protein